MDSISRGFYRGYHSIVAAAPVVVWGGVWLTLSRWKQPAAQGTLYLWRAQCFVAVVFLFLAIFRSPPQKPIFPSILSLSYLVASFLFLAVALLCQIRMLLPMDL
jgi:hypothetical protein